MSGFNLNDYEPVGERIKRFYADHADGGIVTFMRSGPEPIAVFEAQIYIGGILRATGWAQEIRDMELKVSRSGEEYESINYSSWLENAETSAIGRALANFNYSGSLRPSREEMQKSSHRKPATTANLSERAETLRALLDTGGFPEAKTKAILAGMEANKNNPAWFNSVIAQLEKEIKQKMDKGEDA